MADAKKKPAAAAVTQELGDDDVLVELLSPVHHDGKEYPEGAELLLPAAQAKALLDAKAAREPAKPDA